MNPNTLHWTEKIDKKKKGLEKKYDCHCVGKGYPMKDEKQTEIQVQIFQKPSNIAERSPVSYCYNIAHAQTKYSRISCSGSISLENVDFLLI